MQRLNYQPIGLEDFDRQHDGFEILCLGLTLAIREHLCRYVVHNIVSGLERHAATVLSEEERRMEFHSYPELASHAGEHGLFRAEIQRLKRELTCLHSGHNIKHASYELSVEVNRVIVDWLRDHIEHDDRRLGEFLLKRLRR